MGRPAVAGGCGHDQAPRYQLQAGRTQVKADSLEPTWSEVRPRACSRTTMLFSLTPAPACWMWRVVAGRRCSSSTSRWQRYLALPSNLPPCDTHSFSSPPTFQAGRGGTGGGTAALPVNLLHSGHSVSWSRNRIPFQVHLRSNAHPPGRPAARMSRQNPCLQQLEFFPAGAHVQTDSESAGSELFSSHTRRHRFKA